MKTATQSRLYNAKNINASERKHIAFKALRREQPVTHIAQENKVSRQFIYKQKYKAEQAVNDAFKYVFPEAPYDLDNFHIIKDLVDMRRFFKNRLRSAITNRQTFQDKVKQKLLSKNNKDYTEQLEVAKTQENEIRFLSTSIDILVDWMHHDVLNMPGVAPKARHELFDFILDELNQLASLHPHRIKAMCTTLKNQKPFLLAFTDVLNEKFQDIADYYVYPN